MTKSLTIVASAALLVFAGCSNDDGPVLGRGEGALRLNLATDPGVIDAVPATRASQATVVPEAGDLSLEIVKEDGTFSKKWDHASDFPADQTFTIGSYTVTAAWGNPDDEGFEKPYYFGSQNVIVEEGKTSEVSLTASLANTMVSVSYTDAFRNFFSQYSTQLHSAGGDFITFLSDEARPAYLRPGKVTVTLSITKLNGVSATIQPAEFEALARHHYHLTLDVNSGANGEAQLAVIFDDSVVSEDVTVDLSDAVLNAPAPVVNAKGFTPGEPFETLELVPASTPLTMVASAAGGLRSLTLTTQSDALLAKGFPAELDLMAATPSQQALLATLGLDVKGLWNKPDKLAVVDFTKVFSNISGEGTHSFSLVAKDKLGKVNLPLTLTVNTRNVEMSITGTPAAKINATSVDMAVTTNVSDISDLTVETYSFGTWSPARILSTAANTRHRAVGAPGSYTIRFAIPADPDDLPVRLKFKGSVKGESTIVKEGAMLSLESENNVWATHATFKVEHSFHTSIEALNYYLAAGTGSYVKVSAVSFDTANDRVTISGLTPGTKYSVKADEGEASAALTPAATITTERALQLPNAGMEDWCVTESGRNWELRYPGATAEACVWGTNNPMTTSQGGDFGYTRISGTKPVNGRTGQAACISTQGWGSGNSALSGVNGACKYLDPGLMHLGAARTLRPSGYSDRPGPLDTDDLNCGIAFNSRPSALTFWFKYEAKNAADYGQALVEVYNPAGQVIASGTYNLSKQDNFTQVSIPLNYAANAAKAARVYVRFLSTVVPDALTKNADWLNGPGWGNLGRGEYSGSRLYIDDISFTY